MCPGWTAVIGEDYNWVMPFTSKRKFGISYLYQPPFTQQTGVFAKNKNVDIPWREIFSLAQKRYRFWEINFNYATPPEVFPAEFDITTATNFILPLQQSYARLYDRYHNDLKRNIKRSQKFRLVYRPSKDHLKAIDTYIHHYGGRMSHVTADDYEHFKQVATFAATKNNLICREVVNQQNELLASVLLLHDGKRLYNMMNSTTAAGRKVEANHFLIDAVIREFAGSNLILDFEGSDLPGIKTFYQNFGATNQPYYMVKYNNLPWPIKLFKR
jgi:hypothetical protein